MGHSGEVSVWFLSKEKTGKGRGEGECGTLGWRRTIFSGGDY